MLIVNSRLNYVFNFVINWKSIKLGIENPATLDCHIIKLLSTIIYIFFTYVTFKIIRSLKNWTI